MVDVLRTTGVSEWTIDIEGSERYKARWRIEEVRPNAWQIQGLSVIDTAGVDEPLILAGNGSLWEGAAQLNEIGETFNTSVDSYIGLAHNPLKQTALGAAFVGDSTTFSGSRGDMTAAYLEQHHDFQLPVQSFYGGQYDIYHQFATDTLTVQCDWHFASGVEQRLLYSAAIPATAKTPGGLRLIDIPGKSTVVSVNDDSFHFETDSHTPESAVIGNPAHRFELVVTWPIGSGRPIGGNPTWQYAEQERCFIHDTAVSQWSPNGVFKLYQAFSSGAWRNAISSNHVTVYKVRMVERET